MRRLPFCGIQCCVISLQRAKKEGRRFLNPVPTSIAGPSMMFKVLPLYLRNREETEPKRPLGPFVTDPRVYSTEPESGLRITWFGHSSSLLEIDSMRVLLDPIWEQRASPFQWMGPKRFFKPTLQLDQLPALDVVLISHDHYDHLGAHTIRQLARSAAAANARWVTSLGVGPRLRRFGVAANRITELNWTESVGVSGSSGRRLEIPAWPARHFSGRGLSDRFTTLWSSFVLEGPSHRVYFGADSGWWEGFADIAGKYEHLPAARSALDSQPAARKGAFDLTMLEIGAFHPLWASIHLGPDGAARAFEAMGGSARAGLLMPVHWGLFNLALHAWRQPIERLLELAPLQDISLLLPEPGQPTEVSGGKTRTTEWWRRASDTVHHHQLSLPD